MVLPVRRSNRGGLLIWLSGSSPALPGVCLAWLSHLSCMGVQQLGFDDFVLMVRESLSVLDAEPAFQHQRNEVARFMQPPYMAELHLIDTSHVRLSISAHGEILRSVELTMTKDGAWIAWNGIVAIFEMDLT